MGIWRRVKRVPWEYTITEEEKIENFGSLLQEETPGILNWALRGLAEYVKTGRMTYPAKIEDATARYRKEMDIMGRFLSESCTIRSDASVAGSHLYRSYVSWCQSNGFYATNSRKFYKDLRKRLCGTVNENLSNRGAVFVGVGLLVEGHYPSQSDI
jgi:putative DNA primase/helicase